MNTAIYFGDNSYTKESDNNAPVSFVVQRIADGLKRSLAATGVCGAVIKIGMHGQYQRYLDQAINLLPATAPALRISCSKFSQRLGLGSLLFLVSGSSAIDMNNDTEVFHALKRRFGGTPAQGGPLTVFVEHAHLLDTRSERVLSRLVASGTIRLLLLTAQVQDLGEIVTALSKQQKLPVFHEHLLAREDYYEFLSERLGAKITAETGAHYWDITGGSLDALLSTLDRDLAEQNLVLVSGYWQLTSVVSGVAAQGRTAPIHHGQLSSSEYEMLNRMANKRYLLVSEISNDHEKNRDLERLFRLGLVQNLGAGRVGLRPYGSQQSITGPLPILNSDRVLEATSCPVSLGIERIANGSHRLAIDVIERHHFGVAHECDLGECRSIRDLALYSARLNLDLVPEAQEALTFSRNSGPAHRRTFENGHSELNVQQWYLDIRAGRLPKVSFIDDSTEGILTCLRDARWCDESARVIGVLCVAYNWMQEGKLAGSSRLLRWALDAFERSEFFLRDERSSLWLPHTVFLLSYLSLCHQDWRSMNRVDAVLSRSEHKDVTAIGYAMFFQILRKIARGEVKDGTRRFTDLAASGKFVFPEHFGINNAGFQMLLVAMGGLDQGEVKVPEKVEDAVKFGAKNRWSQIYIRHLYRAFKNPDGKLAAELTEHLDQLLAQGSVFPALQVTALCVSLGHPVSREHMRSLADTVATEYALKIELLNEALWSNDEKAIVDLSCALASSGLYFHAALPLQRIDKGKTVFRRQLQRSITSLVTAPADLRQDRSAQPERTESANKNNNWCAPLTSRERSVAVMAARGLRNSELAEHFGISVRTIEGHLYQVQVKLNLRNRKELRELVNTEPRGKSK